MASISWTFDHPAFNRTTVKTLPDGHFVRLADALRAAYIANGKLTDDTSNAAVMDQLFWDFLLDLKARVLAYEKKVASDGATSGIIPIAV